MQDNYIAEMESKLNQWRAKFYILRARAQQMTPRLDSGIRDQFDACVERQKETRRNLGAIRDANDDSWQKLQEHVEKSWENMREALREAARRVARAGQRSIDRATL